MALALRDFHLKARRFSTMDTSNYDLRPKLSIEGFGGQAWAGYEAIGEALGHRAYSLKKNRVVLAVECYPGVNESEVFAALLRVLDPSVVVRVSEALRPGAGIEEMLAPALTDDRVRGVMMDWRMEQFFDEHALDRLRERVEQTTNGLVLVYGTGASLVGPADLLVYADLARWEIQLRYRSGKLANWCADNEGEDFLRMYKRGFFVDWRVADHRKRELYDRIDFLLDTNQAAAPRMVTGEAFRGALRQASSQPFRMVPYFDSGPWGGDWMKRTFELDGDAPNYAWCFDGVPEENSLLLDFDGTLLEVPAINLVLHHPDALLGSHVHERFGAEFPIRFDLLDAMGGGNLSLQVHPTTEYIREQFGIPYTQDESYYLLDADEDAVVYLGLKTDTDTDRMFAELEEAQSGGAPFDAEKFVNAIPARRHDHFLIPAGTIHCSGRNSMVLEISATPYIFTFKLWDWGRLGLDGKPRPIHIDHGRAVLNHDCDTELVMREMVNRVEPLAAGAGWREERTGLHPSEFIESRRHWFTGTVPHDTKGTVNVLNLVQGSEAIVESPTGDFPPLVVHFAETFIIPAATGAYTIRPHGPAEGTECATVKASVRG